MYLYTKTAENEDVFLGPKGNLVHDMYYSSFDYVPSQYPLRDISQVPWGWTATVNGKYLRTHKPPYFLLVDTDKTGPVWTFRGTIFQGSYSSSKGCSEVNFNLEPFTEFSIRFQKVGLNNLKIRVTQNGQEVKVDFDDLYKDILIPLFEPIMPESLLLYLEVWTITALSVDDFKKRFI